MSRPELSQNCTSAAIGSVGDLAFPRSTLPFQGVSGRLAERNIFVDDRDRVPVLGERQTNLIDDLALSVIGLLDRGIVDPLERHAGVARIAGDRILLAV